MTTSLELMQALPKLRRATQELGEEASKVETFKHFIGRAIDKLVVQFPQFANYNVSPGWQPSTPRMGILTLKSANEEFRVQFSLPQDTSEEAWELLQLWGEMVKQVWLARPQDDLVYRVQLYRGLTQIIENISGQLANELVLTEACKSIVELIDAVDHVGVVLHDDHKEGMGVVVAEYPLQGNIGIELKLKGYRVFETMNKSLAPLVVNDVVNAQDLLGENHPILVGAGIKSVLLLPLVIQGSFVGSIGLDALKDLHTWTTAEVETLNNIATQLSISIQNTELFEEVNARIISEALTTRVTERLPLRSDLNTLMLTAARELGLMIGATRAHIYLNADYMNLHFDDVAPSKEE
jgi:hypothetical protein